MASNKQLKARCERLRGERHVSQRELADALYVSTSLMSKYESGNVRWPRVRFDQYCEVLRLNEVEKADLERLVYGAVHVFGLAWVSAGAIWDDVQRTHAILRQDDPHFDFGKVESDIIYLTESKGVVLRIGVRRIDLNASYTVQILDKHSEVATDVLKGIIYPGLQSVNLTEALIWDGEQAFTINLWINGKGKSAEFGFIEVDMLNNLS